MKKFVKRIILGFVIIFLTACGAGGPPGEATIIDGQSTGLERFYDYEAGVVCWSRVMIRESLACLPIEQTKLNKGR
jgi:predicted amidohydrolase